MALAVVTGAAGFIGSHLVDLLLTEGHRVVALDMVDHPHRIAQHISKPDFAYGHGNIVAFDEDFPIWAGVDWVFHLAGLADIEIGRAHV